jgi:hypothetical protein
LHNAGVRRLDGFVAGPIPELPMEGGTTLEPVKVVASPAVTHVKYRLG